jgi:hypothetical protein
MKSNTAGLNAAFESESESLTRSRRPLYRKVAALLCKPRSAATIHPVRCPTQQVQEGAAMRYQVIDNQTNRPVGTPVRYRVQPVGNPMQGGAR